MAAEPISEQVAEAFRTTLGAIDPALDTKYWYKPDKVVRADVDKADQIEAAPYDYVIIITPGDEHVGEETSQTIGHLLDIYITVAHKWKGATKNIFLRDPVTDLLRWTYQNRMVGDVTRALAKVVQLGGLVDNCMNRVDVIRDFDIPEGWAIAVIRCQVIWDRDSDVA